MRHTSLTTLPDMKEWRRIVGLLPIVIFHCVRSCQYSLVTGPHGVSNDAITASSTHGSWQCKTYMARFNSQIAWCPENSASGHYIQVEFPSVSLLKAIMTLGRGNADQRVTAYKVSTSMDGVTWTDILTSTGGSRVFPGNFDSDTVVTNELEGTVVAKFVRITAVSVHSYGSMRLEIRGCPVKCDACVRWKAQLGSARDVLPVLLDTDARNQGECGVKCSRQPGCSSFVFDVAASRCRLLRETTPVGAHTTVNLDGAWYFVQI